MVILLHPLLDCLFVREGKRGGGGGGREVGGGLLPSLPPGLDLGEEETGGA